MPGVGQCMGMVMIHGVLADATQWYDVAARIPGAIATERRGPGEPGYDVNSEVEHAHELLDAAGPNPILFGHSYGAVIALLVAQQRDDLHSVVLYEPIATGQQLRDFVGNAVERAGSCAGQRSERRDGDHCHRGLADSRGCSAALPGQRAIGAELVLLKDLGHVAHMEAPDVLAAAITS